MRNKLFATDFKGIMNIKYFFFAINNFINSIDLFHDHRVLNIHLFYPMMNQHY